MSALPTTIVSSRQRLAVVVAIALGLIWSQYSGTVARVVAPAGIAGLPYSRSFLASVSDVVVLLLLLVLVARVSGARAWRVVGLHGPPAPAIVSLVALLAAASAICVTAAPFSDSVTVADLAWLGMGGPFFEEVTYRGLAVGSLMLLAGWRFLPAVLVPSVMFGAAHAWQGSGLQEVAGIVAITTAGGLLFGWLYVRWGFNLWPAIIAHMGLNLIWVAFALGESAIGGWFGNVLRLSLVTMIVVTTWWLSSPAVASRWRSRF